MTHDDSIRPTASWLRTMAAAEDESSVSVGGLAHDVGLLQSAGGTRPSKRVRWAFGRFVEYARRDRNLTVEQLAQLAHLEVDEVLAMEGDLDYVPEPRSIDHLAQVLCVSQARLMELAGLAAPRDPALSQAAVRFAAKSEPTAQLQPHEREAFDEFVNVLAAKY